MTIVTFFVPNISCGHCVRTITTELSEVNGVLSVRADQETKKVEVEFNSPASEEKIKVLLALIDYPVAV